MLDCYIIGAGMLAKQIYNCFKHQVNFVAFIDTPRYAGEHYHGVPVTETPPKKGKAVLGVSNIYDRFRLWKKYSFSPITLIHETARIGSTTSIDEGSVIFPDAIIEDETVIGKHVYIGYRTLIGHDCRVDDFSVILNYVVLSVTVVDRFCCVGNHACTINNYPQIAPITLGVFSFVGAGAMVTKDVKAGETVVGIPAKRKS